MFVIGIDYHHYISLIQLKETSDIITPLCILVQLIRPVCIWPAFIYVSLCIIYLSSFNLRYIACITTKTIIRCYITYYIYTYLSHGQKIFFPNYPPMAIYDNLKTMLWRIVMRCFQLVLFYINVPVMHGIHLYINQMKWTPTSNPFTLFIIWASIH